MLLRGLAALLGVSLATTGCCMNNVCDVRKSASASNYCPENRVTVTLVPPPPPQPAPACMRPTPPEEVAADPERKAIWDQQHGSIYAGCRPTQSLAGESRDVDYDVEACGRTFRYHCTSPWRCRRVTHCSRAVFRREPLDATRACPANGTRSTSAVAS